MTSMTKTVGLSLTFVVTVALGSSTALPRLRRHATPAPAPP